MSLAAPGPASAQGWAPVSIGGRVGYDNKQRDEVLGAQIHIPVVRSGVVEFLPNVDATFRPLFNEYQINLEAVYVLGDRTGGGLYAGGGVGFRWRRSNLGTWGGQPQTAFPSPSNPCDG